LDVDDDQGVAGAGPQQGVHGLRIMITGRTSHGRIAAVAVLLCLEREP
jgi:hypothetical protein